MELLQIYHFFHDSGFIGCVFLRICLFIIVQLGKGMQSKVFQGETGQWAFGLVSSVLSPAVRWSNCGEQSCACWKLPLCLMWSQDSQYPPINSASGCSHKSWGTGFVVQTLHSSGRSWVRRCLPDYTALSWGGMKHWIYGKAGTWIYCWKESRGESDREVVSVVSPEAQSGDISWENTQSHPLSRGNWAQDVSAW